jgi:opacity protein-like surface antigen
MARHAEGRAPATQRFRAERSRAGVARAMLSRPARALAASVPRRGKSMKTMGIAAALAAVASATPAFAQAAEGGYLETPVRAPERAFELGVNTGYTQGFGLLSRGRPVSVIAGPGFGAGIDLGYRATPGFSIGVAGQFQGFSASSDLPAGTMVRGGSADLQGTFHMAPYDRVDPWITVGGGYRAVWEVPLGSAPTIMTHGFELGKLQLGLDLRASESVAVSPTIGAGVDMFVWQNTEGAEAANLRGRGVSGFLFAGLAGRFDLGGARANRPEAVTKTAAE